MKWGRFIFSLLTAVIFFWLVLWITKVELSEILRLTAQCDPMLLLLGMAAYAGAYAFRALRFKLLLRREAPPLPALLCIVSMHNLFNMILPVRTGELSYIYMLRTRFQVASTTGLATLVVARVLDLLCLMLFLAVGLLYYNTRLHLSTPWVLLACLAVFLVAFAALLNLPGIAVFFLRAFRKTMSWFGQEDRSIIQKLTAKGDEAVSAFQSIRSRNLLISAFLLSLVVCLCIYLTCYAVLLSFPGVDPDEFTFGRSIVGTSAMNITCVLPINAFGNLGTWEAGWAAGYTFVDMTTDLAVKTGAGSHIAVSVYALLLALMGWLGLKFYRR